MFSVLSRFTAPRPGTQQLSPGSVRRHPYLLNPLVLAVLATSVLAPVHVLAHGKGSAHGTSHPAAMHSGPAATHAGPPAMHPSPAATRPGPPAQRHFNHGHAGPRGHVTVFVGPPLGYVAQPYYYPPPYYDLVPDNSSPLPYVEQGGNGTVRTFFLYCADPPGYYPQVQQCLPGWQAIPSTY